MTARIKKAVSVFMAAVLFAMSLGSSVLTVPAYAAEAAPDPGMAEEPEEAAVPEAAADMAAVEAADPKGETTAADPKAENAAADPIAENADADSKAEESAADPMAGSGTNAEAASAGEGKYISDVFIAYGKSVEDAEKWLVANGWEPLPDNNNFNAGKASKWDESIAASMGIRRTNDPEKAITDMAIMNMKGGYSFPDYEALLEEKKTEIDEFIYTFLPVIKEYRANYNGAGSAQGKKRAEMAYELLNKFYDGDSDAPYARNDTGLPLGKLFLAPLLQESETETETEAETETETGTETETETGTETETEGKEQPRGDMQQIVLESSGAALIAVEHSLALAADTADTTWLERVPGMTMEKLINNLGDYVPEAAGQDVPYSAALSYLTQTFGDSAEAMQSQWSDIHEKMIRYEDFNTEHDLWMEDGESEEDFRSRSSETLDKLLAEDPDVYKAEVENYQDDSVLYWGLYDIEYPGEWGETLGDFFNPAEDSAYVFDSDNYIPLAAALSEGQRRSLQLISLDSLIRLGLANEDAVRDLFPDVEEILGEAESISVYSGINRGIYRGGVALTSKALMQKDRGYDPFGNIYDFKGMYNILCYSAAAVSMISIVAGIGCLVHARNVASGSVAYQEFLDLTSKFSAKRDLYQITYDMMDARRIFIEENGITMTLEQQLEQAREIGGVLDNLVEAQDNLAEAIKESNRIAKDIGYTQSKMAGKVLLGVGGSLLIIAAAAKAYQIYKFYQKDFTPIPLMIVDEADIVQYIENDDGTSTKLINFDQFVYYQAARCNRLKIKKISDWQDGVEDYEEWGCGDVADLNGDQGQEWLALYTVKSSKKGYPILADSLTLQYGSDAQPEGTTRSLHFFTYTYAADVGDTAYSYNNKKNGIYFFWDEDPAAYDVPKETASTFSSGYLALSGLGGLLLGILGTTIVLYPRRKKVMAEM